MRRVATDELLTWARQRDRRPLVLRGARQVGKTWLVRDLAERAGLRLVEVNFERNPEMAKHFTSRDPSVVLSELSLALGNEIVPERSLLFLDEIQAAGEVLAGLRWFAEEMPNLTLVTAGSLLEFTLAAHDFSMPVGRIQYAYLDPMSFPEYLAAHGQRTLLERLQTWTPGRVLSPAASDQATKWFQRYMMVGGMPGVVQLDLEGAEPRTCRRRQQDLLATYRDDFAKYTTRIDRTVLDTVLRTAAASLGRKFVYARVGEGVKQHQAKRALELLEQARLCTLICHSSANGLPLGGEVNLRFRKALLLDVGLVHAMLGTPAEGAFPRWRDIAPQVRGQLIAQTCGQQLRNLDSDLWGSTPLHYWQRQGGRPGEVDYLLQLGLRIVPVELKAGAAGAMKSLHQFVHDKALSLAVRLDENPPSVQDLDLKTTQGDRVSYRLLSLPHYLAWDLRRIVDAVGA